MALCADNKVENKKLEAEENNGKDKMSALSAKHGNRYPRQSRKRTTRNADMCGVWCMQVHGVYRGSDSEPNEKEIGKYFNPKGKNNVISRIE